MRFSPAAIATVPPLIIAVIAGSYLVRWLAVLVLGAFLAFVLFGFEIRISLPRRGREYNVRRKTDIERLQPS